MQVGQRSPQLVREAEYEVAPLAFLVLEAAGHLVERVGKRCQLSRARPGYAHVIGAGGDPTRGARDFDQRSLDLPRHQHRQKNRAGQRRGRGSDQDPCDRGVEHVVRDRGGRSVRGHQGFEGRATDHEDPGRHQADGDQPDERAGQRDPGGQ
jgi:hypothetical protein